MRHTHPIVKLLSSIPLLALGACGSDSASIPFPESAQPEVFDAPRGEDYLVGYGETIHVGELTLEFTAVAEDTRCPFEATCLAGWIGNARILVSVARGGMVGMLELNTHPDLPVRENFAGYLVELRDLAPWLPRRLGPPDQYVATLHVARVTP